MTKKKNFHYAGAGKKALWHGQVQGMGPFNSRRSKCTKEPFTGVFVTEPEKKEAADQKEENAHE